MPLALMMALKSKCRSDGQVVSVTDCSVNDSGSLPTRDTDYKVFNARSLNCRSL